MRNRLDFCGGLAMLWSFSLPKQRTISRAGSRPPRGRLFVCLA